MKSKIQHYKLSEIDYKNGGDWINVEDFDKYILQLKEQHRVQLKEVARNVRHKACDLLTESNLNSEQYSFLHKAIMNIKFNEVKPTS